MSCFSFVPSSSRFGRFKAVQNCKNGDVVTVVCQPTPTGWVGKGCLSTQEVFGFSQDLVPVNRSLKRFRAGNVEDVLAHFAR